MIQPARVCLVLCGLVATSACSKKEGGGGGGGGGGGTVVGKLTPQEHKSPDGKLTVKGPMPAAWKPREVMNKGEMALAQPSDSPAPPGQITVGIKPIVQPDATPQSSASELETAAKGGGYEIVVPTTEVAPGRWGYVGKLAGMQYRPGIDMFEGTVVWKLADGQYTRCHVRWNGTSANGALDLCKELEVTAPPLQ